MQEEQFFSLAAPIGIAPAARQIRAASLDRLPELASAGGVSLPRILEPYGLKPGDLRDADSYIPAAAMLGILDQCRSAFDDALFGLRLAEQQEADVYGCVTMLCRAAPTVRAALECKRAYLPLVYAADAAMTLVEGSEICELRLPVRAEAAGLTQAYLHGMLLNLKLLRVLCGSNFRPSYVTLAIDARPRDLAGIAAFFGCEFRVNREMNAMGIPAAMLDRPVPSRNRLAFQLLRGYLDQVKTAARRTLKLRVQDYVRATLESGRCSLEHCARSLRLSPRAVQAELDRVGQSFSAIVQSERLTASRHYLEQSVIPLAEIAARAGYSEQSSFSRAFKKATGLTPRQCRHMAKAAARPH